MLPVALTIAGSDPSGGAGLQADLKTFHTHRVYGESVVTLITVQNTTRVSRVELLSPGLVVEQLDAVLEDIPPAAAKTGALGSAAIVEAVAERAAAFGFPLVVDPVMVSKHGAELLDEAAQVALRERLMPHATLITPNLPEAALLSGRSIEDAATALDAAHALVDLGARAVLLKGGHAKGDATDLLLVDGKVERLVAPRLETRAGHGTGCTLAAAITARLARGDSLAVAVRGAKRWLTEALRAAPGLGAGVGPVDHLQPARGLRGEGST